MTIFLNVVQKKLAVKQLDEKKILKSFTQNIIFKCTEDKNSWFGILFFHSLKSKCQCKKLEKIIIKHIFTLSSDVILTIRWGMSF